ncbi:MAG TPA: hypothetical protein VMV86_06790, partial [Methanosarcinales archaeon]|nr:hypothetical protein [Methanosarcinales archaeon]
GYVNYVWPFCSNDVDGYDDYANLTDNIDGTYPVFPLVITMSNPNKNILGELQGCFAIPAFGGVSAEDTITIDGDTYIAFPIIPNADRNDFWALKKE